MIYIEFKIVNLNELTKQVANKIGYSSAQQLVNEWINKYEALFLNEEYEIIFSKTRTQGYWNNNQNILEKYSV
jgi:hypothetical protein